MKGDEGSCGGLTCASFAASSCSVKDPLAFINASARSARANAAASCCCCCAALAAFAAFAAPERTALAAPPTAPSRALAISSVGGSEAYAIANAEGTYVEVGRASRGREAAGVNPGCAIADGGGAGAGAACGAGG